MNTTTLTGTVWFPIDFIMKSWYPLDGFDPISWTDYMGMLRADGRLHSLYPQPQAWAYGTQPEPVVLGGDGTIWSGEDVIVAAYMKGRQHLNVAFALERHA